MIFFSREVHSRSKVSCISYPTRMVKKTDEPKIKKVLLTEAGLRKSEEELEQLKNDGRKEISKRLKEAIAYGDLSENAEYD